MMRQTGFGKYWLMCALAIWISLRAFAQPTNFVVQYPVGDTCISIVENCYKSCPDKLVFLNLHDNEQTSRLAADSFLRRFGGLLVHIANDSVRNITIPLADKRYTFDPNRIYSKGGRLASLMLLSEQKDSIAEPEASYFAKQILQNYVDKKALVVALHNNSDSNFSVLTYVASQDSIPGSGKTFVNPKMDVDDFVLTSDKKIFDTLAAHNINAVWENVDRIADDGSLSVYASRRRIPYVNIEAEHGHLAQQMMMMEALENVFLHYRKNAQHGSQKTKRKKTTNL